MAKRAASGFRNVTHCIFDMDGLLLDTESIYEEIVRKIAASFGKPYPMEVRMKILGTTEQNSAATIVNDLQLPLTVPEYMKQYNSLCSQMFGNVNTQKGAERLLRHLHKNKVPIALATSSGEESVELKTTKHRDLFTLFHHKVCGSTDPDVKNGKPAPDIFLIAAQRFPDNPSPDTCLVFEDAPNGVKAAQSAGMQCVMVPEDFVPENMRTATQVLKSLEDFKPEEFGLPAF